MMSDARRLFAFDAMESIASATVLPEVETRFSRTIANMGFTAFGIAEMPPRGKGANPIIAIESQPAGFRQYYERNHLYNINHLAAHMRVCAQPFRFSEAPSSPERARDNQRFMWIMRGFGIGQGVIVPVGRPGQFPACVWVDGEDPDMDDETVRLIHLIGVFAASRTYALLHPRQECRPDLTVREREVLTWAAHGKSAWEIGQILAIAKRTVDEHTQNAAHKLGAVNKTQAVALALMRRIIML
jgi:LuxR family quorum sensing-dependent transcriptional regulator